MIKIKDKAKENNRNKKGYSIGDFACVALQDRQWRIKTENEQENR